MVENRGGGHSPQLSSWRPLPGLLLLPVASLISKPDRGERLTIYGCLLGGCCERTNKQRRIIIYERRNGVWLWVVVS